MNTQDPATKIVVAVNLEHEEHISIAKAKLLAANINAEIHLLVSVYDSVAQYSEFLSTALNNFIENDLIVKAEKALDTICDELQREGYKVVPHVRWSQNIATALDDLTMILLPNYVVKRVCDDMNLFNPFATAQDRQCIRHSRGSLLLSRHAHLNYQQIAIALDILATDPQHVALNHQLIKEGKRLAKMTGANLALINVYDMPFKHVGKQIEDYNTKDLQKSIERHHENKMLEYIDEHDLPLDSYHIVDGHAGDTLAAYVEMHHVDLLIMGTAMRNGFNAVFLGNAAEDVLMRVNCELLCIPLIGGGRFSHIDDIQDFEDYDDFSGEYH